jgi:hypothetical protein
MVLAYGFGSIALIHAGMFSGHGMAGAFGFFGFVALIRLKEESSLSLSETVNLSPYPNKKGDISQDPVRTKSKKCGIAFATLGGLSTGLGALCDYTAMYIAVVLSIYAFIVHIPVRNRLAFISGGVLCVILLGAYNWHCFGSPFTFSYATQMTREFAEQSKQGFLGITLPKTGPLIALLFSPSRGLFAIMPVFLFSLLGLWHMLQGRSLRIEAVVILVVFLGYLMINAGFYGWHGGWAYGPRYLVPILPFLAVPLVFAPRPLPLACLYLFLPSL